MKKIDISENKVEKLSKQLTWTQKGLSKGVEKSSVVPLGQALSLEEHYQLEFFCRALELECFLFLLLLLRQVLPGKDASGAMQLALQKAVINKLGEKVQNELMILTHFDF